MKTHFRVLCAAVAFCLMAAGCSFATAGSITLPAGLQVIEEEAFCGVQDASEVVIPQNVTHIENRAFADSSIEKITFPDQLVAVASNAFENAPVKNVITKVGTVGYDWAVAHGIDVPGGVRKLRWVIGGPAPADNDQVVAALNEISREKLGVEVEILYMSDYELRAALEAGETYDMYFTCSWFNNYQWNIDNGNFLDISEALPEAAPDLYATLTETIWDLAAEEDGSLYSVPIKKDMAPMFFMVYDADIAEQAGIEMPESVTDLDDLTDYLVALKAAMEQDPSLGSYPVVLDGTIPGLDLDFDYIDRDALIGVSYGDTQVHSLLDDEEVMNRYRVLHEWYEMGLVTLDAEQGNNPHSVHFVQAWTGYNYSAAMGYRAGMVNYTGPVLNSAGVKGAMTAFGSQLANDPEKLALCLQYQELVNTDQEYRDILAYGVPGVHFNYTANETVQRTDQGYSNYSPWRFAQASYAVNSIEAVGDYPVDTNQWNEYFAEVENAPASTLGSFTFDRETPIDFTQAYGEIISISNVYLPGIQNGTADTNTSILEMHRQMNNAGLQDIITEAQRQLDEYLANR